MYIGEWDGAGAIVKTRLRNEQLRNLARMLQNASNVVAFLEETLSTGIAMSHPRFQRDEIYQYFHEVAAVPRDESDVLNSDCEVLVGSRSFHLVSTISAADLAQLLVRYLSYFCGPYIGQDSDACMNQAHVQLWLLKRLVSKNPRVIR